MVVFGSSSVGLLKFGQFFWESQVLMESTSGYFVAGTKNQFLVLNADDSIKVRSLN